MSLKRGWFDWDTDEIEVSNRLALAQNERARIMILTPKFASTGSHYVKEEGQQRPTVKECRSLDGEECEECKKGNIPKQRFGTVVVRYRALKPEIQWDMLPWLFGSDKYMDLKKIVQSGWTGKNSKGVKVEITAIGKSGFLHHDVMLDCYNQTFQRVKMELCEFAVWDKVPGLKEEIIAAFKQERASGRLDVLAMLTGKVLVEPPVEVEHEGTTEDELEEATTGKPANGVKTKPAPAAQEELDLGLDDKPVPPKKEAAKTTPPAEKKQPPKAETKKSDVSGDELEAIIDDILK